MSETRFFSRRHQTRAAHRNRARLEVECLEGRIVPSVNVNTDVEAGIHNETTIAVNPTNPLNMIGSANDYESRINAGGQLYYTILPRARVTFDGGQTWTTYTVPLTGYNSCSDPAISFDADGTAYLASVGAAHPQSLLHQDATETAHDIIVSRSTDGGQNWSKPVRVAQGSGTKHADTRETDQDKEYVTAWGHGNALVTWTQFNRGPQGEFIDGPLYTSLTQDGGQHWTAPTRIAGPIGFAGVPTVAADGSIYVAYQDRSDEVAPYYRDHYKVIKVDPATGEALGAPVEVSQIHNGIKDSPTNAVGRPTYQDSQFRSPYGIGNITADPTNALHLALIWSDMRNNPYPNGELPSRDPYQVLTNSDIIISQTLDGGMHWSVPTAIATPNDQFEPWGAYDASGRLQIGYYDRSYDPANHKYGYTLASETAPGAFTFATQQVTTALSDPTRDDAYFTVTVNSNFPNATTFLGDYTGIAVTPTGVAALWTDMRVPSPFFPGSGEDVFFALVRPPGAMAAMSAADGTAAHALSRSRASGVETSPLHGVNVRIGDLSGTTLAVAFGKANWADQNAAWVLVGDLTSTGDCEPTIPGDQDDHGRQVMLSVLEGHIGRPLDQAQEADGLTAGALTPGIRLMLSSGFDLLDVDELVLARS